MARVLLLDPRGWQGAVSGYGAFPNVGIAYLVSSLRHGGHEVAVVDLNNEEMTDEEALDRIESFAPDMVGFSCKTATMKSARELCKKLKQRMPETFTLLGGPHSKISWIELVQEPWFDAIFIGEGEFVLSELVARVARGESIDDLSGVLTRNKVEGLVGEPEVAMIPQKELDVMPFPAYDLFPENVQRNLAKTYPLVTSRGCVYKCTFCSVPAISGTKFRKRAAECVVGELEAAKELYGASSFEIMDDILNLDIKRCKDVCRMIIEADLDMTWSCPNGLRADRVDQEMAELMVKAGCRSVMVGVESGNPEVLALVDKGETLDHIEHGIRTFKDAGLHVGGYFIIGLPGDSYSSVEQSVEFAQRVEIEAHFNLLTPYPGTPLWDWAHENARFLKDPEDGIHFRNDSSKIEVTLETDAFPAEERLRAYEMAHTRMDRFDMLVDSGQPRWKRRMESVGYLWKYDRSRVPGFVAERFVPKPFRRGKERELRRERKRAREVASA